MNDITVTIPGNALATDLLKPPPVYQTITSAKNVQVPFLTCGAQIDDGETTGLILQIFNQEDDVQAMMEVINPGQYISPLSPDFDFGRPPSTRHLHQSVDQTVANFIEQCIKVTAANREILGEFDGVDWGEEDLINTRYFSNPPIRSFNTKLYVQLENWGALIPEDALSFIDDQDQVINSVKFNFTDAPSSWTVTAQGQFSDMGWIPAVTGSNIQVGDPTKRLETIKLLSNNAPGYSTWYRVYVKGNGWTDWVKDNQQAGTVGQSLPLFGQQIEISMNN